MTSDSTRMAPSSLTGDMISQHSQDIVVAPGAIPNRREWAMGISYLQVGDDGAVSSSWNQPAAKNLFSDNYVVIEGYNKDTNKPAQA